MHRIDTPTAQKDKFGAGKNGFTKGDPQTGTPATEIDETILDAVQEEICSVIESAKIQLNKSSRNQLLEALKKTFLTNDENGKDINDKGEFLKSLGLSDLVLAGVVTGVLSDPGRLVIPMIINGVRRECIVQIGQIPCANQTTTTSIFPIPFPNACLKVVGWGYQGTGGTQAYTVFNGSTRTNFSWNAFFAASGAAPSLATAGSVVAHYIAIGY